MSKKWSQNFDACVSCGTTEIKHHGKGLCDKCYKHFGHIKRATKQAFVCIQCNKVFFPKFYSRVPRKFCSQECSIKYHAGKNRGKVKTKAEVIAKMRAAILEAGYYIPQPKLMRAAGICYETYVKLGISILDVYAGLGIKKYLSKEDRAYYALKPYIPDIKVNKSFDDCRSPKGYKLRFDLFSEDLGLLIEIDGEHHRFNTKVPEMAFVLECDRIKDDYAKRKGFEMVRIPFARKEYPTLNNLLSHFPEDIRHCL